MRLLHRPLVVAAAGLLVGCSAHVPPAPPPTHFPLPPVTIAKIDAPRIVIAADPVLETIANAEREFAAGQTELDLGHLVGARKRFDASVDSLLQFQTGARGDPRLRAEFDRLLDRINALEVIALREGDGFSEARSEPAVIDELLKAATFERPEPAAATEEAVTADLAHTPHDLPITINPRVLSFIELLQGNLRDFMQDGLDRGAQYLPMIQDVFRSEGLPLDLAYVPLIESAFQPTALSRAAAKGIWQFELSTAKDYGLQQNWFLDERSDPEKATRAAAQHLKMLGGMFDDDWNMALASYNAGQGRVLHAAKLAKTNDFWKLTSTSRYLPRETRDYVPMILAAIIIAKNPSQYGFEVTAAEPLKAEAVTVPDALDLRVIAEWTGVGIDTIRDLNPELRRTTTPLGKHELKVPFGTAATIEAKLADADPSIFVPYHLVKGRETLASIAQSYHTTVAKLASANDLKTNARLKTGQALIVPRAADSVLTSRTTPTPAATTASAHPATPPVSYRVKPGDTLFGIARQFDTTVEDLKRLNQMSSDMIVVGDKLTVRK